jgi:seryl-tRNA synthetase
MIDIRALREDPDAVKAALARRGVEAAEVDAVIAADADWRARVKHAEDLRADVKSLSREVGQARKGGDAARAEELTLRSRALGEEERAAAAEADVLEEQVRTGLLYLPNIPADDAPDGTGEEDNVELRRWWPGQDLGKPEPQPLEHQQVPHWEIGEALQILDMERGARLAGSMFPLYRGAGARLLRALTAFAIDRHSPEYEEIRPPTAVLTETMVSTGHLPKFADDAYHIERDDLWLIPTAEVPLTSVAAGEVLDPAGLPMRLMAYTPCFRREAGAAGRDTRGLLRVHEFDKVEILAYTTAEQAAAMHDELLARAEGALAALGLAYRVLDLCAGDLGASSARTFDLEVYAPGCDMWLEASSVSWFSDYQARRAGIRYRGEGGNLVAHTLNGSALAVPRVWAAVVETYRMPDGSVAVPEVLQPYFRGADRIA